MALNSQKVLTLHKEILENYKNRLDEIEAKGKEEQEEPFERSFLHNAIYLHNLWFEQITDASPDSSSPLLEDILMRRDSDLNTFQTWLNRFALDADPHGWAIWGWSYSLKTFIGCPIRSHDYDVPLGVVPLLVIDCWAHSYIEDFGLGFQKYLDSFWKQLNWEVIEQRHKELTHLFGFGIK